MANRSITLTLRANASGLESGMRQAQRSTRQTADEFRRLSDAAKESLNDVGGKLMVGGGVLAAGFGVAVKKFADFDKAMSSVSAATHASEADMKSLRDAAVKAGADTAFSAVEAAQAIEELAKAGVSTQDIMGGGLDGALSLAAAGSLDVGKAAEIASSALTQFELKGSDVSHVADLLAAGAGKAQGGVEDLGMAMNQSGLVAAQTGLSIEETVGGLTAFANAGLIGSDAGTSFKTMLQSLTPSSKEAAQLMDELGITAYDAQGNFVGLSQFAGNLQSGLRDLSVEQQNAAMKTIFGSDAVRAASVLFKEGAEGVKKWTDAVNDSGYAADTAARMQDNLAGDLEKLGGSLDTVFLKSGSGANDFLRGLVQGAEDLVDTIGNIPEGVLSTGAMIAGLGGGALLAMGGMMKLTTSVSDALASWRNLKANAPGAAKAIGAIGKTAGAVAIAVAALEIGKAIYNSTAPAERPLADFTLMLNDAESGVSSLNKAIAEDNFSSYNWIGMTSGVNNLGEAFRSIDTSNLTENLDSFWADMGWENNTKRVKNFFKGLDDSLAQAASAGDYEKVSAGLKDIEGSLSEGGVKLDEFKPKLTGLMDALKQKAADLGASNLSDDDIWKWATTGDLPQQVQDVAAKMSEADRAAAGLGSSVASIPDKSPTLQELSDAAAAAANSFLTARDASRGFEEAIDAAAEARKKNGKTLNEDTAAGRENAEALDNIAASALKVMDGAESARDKMVALGEGRAAVIKAAEAFGMGAKQAAAYADSAGMIPSSVYTEFDSNADDLSTKLGEVKAIMDSVPKNESITIKENSPSVIAGLEALGYKVETLPKGQIKVTQTGAKVAQAQIEAVAKKVYNATLTASVANAGYAESVLNAIARGRNATITVNTVQVGQAGNVTYGKSDGHGRPTIATGGRLLGSRKSLTGYAGGGKLPRTGLGTDQILGVSPTTGRPTAWVDDEEWVVNARSSEKYNGLLSLINADAPSVQGLAALASGGRVGWSVKDQGKSKAGAAKATSQRKAAAAKVRAEEKDVNAAQKAYDKIDSTKKNKSRKASAKANLNKQKAQLKAAEKKLKAAEKAEQKAKDAYQADRERTTRLRELEFDTRRDLYRGDIRDNYGAGNYSGVDALFEASNNKDLSDKQRKNLRALAYAQEKQTKGLTLKQGMLEKRLESAQSKADELKGVRDGVRDSVKGALDFGSLTGQKDSWGHDKPVTKKAVLSYAKGIAAGAKKLSGKLAQLKKLGFPQMMLEQVIDEWTGSQTFELADALLAMNKSERGQLTSALKSTEKYGLAAGQTLTETMYSGGYNAAQGLVKGLESQISAVEREFTKMATRGEKAFKKALGIKSPSRVLKAAGVWAGKGAALGVRDSIPENERAMRDLAEAQAAAYQPQYRVPASPEVQAYAVAQGSSAYVTRDELMTVVTQLADRPINAQLAVNGRQAGVLVQEGTRWGGNNK